MTLRLAVAVLFVARAALAQATLARETPLLASPNGRALATIARGTAVRAEASRGSMVGVQLEGWVSTALLGASRDSFAVSVAKSEAILRAAPATTGTRLATLVRGMGLHVVSRGPAWTRVRRSGWIARSAIAAAPARAPAPASRPAPIKPATRTPARSTATAPITRSAAAQGSAAAADSAPAPDDLTPLRPTPLSAAPDGRQLSTVQPGVVLQPLAHDRGWVRVRIEGWVPERDLIPADTAIRSPSAADLRADPDGMRGRVVRWTVEVLAFRKADALRPDLQPGEPYLLVRGPGDENALIYLTLPAALVDRARALAPTSRIVVSARVRTGRSQPTGVPVLDVLTLAVP